MAKDAGKELLRLCDIMRRLRAEGGCPWDRAQDLRSLRPYLIEEAYEVLDEMDRVAEGGSWMALCEELGDLLFQIVFHAQLATELGEFEMADVCRAIGDKIESRHPHVFGETKVTGAEEVLQNWAKLKAAERKKKTGREGSVLDGVPTFAPALQRAERLTEKASRVGFDWPDLAGVRAKLDEELRELEEAIASKDRDRIEHELGDVLFSIANLARFIQTPPEDALRGANARFTRRFHEIEAGLRAQGIPFGEASLEQMEALWQKAKAAEVGLAPALDLPRATVPALVLPCADPSRTAAFWMRAADVLRWRVCPRTSPVLEVDTGALLLRFEPSTEGPGHAAVCAELPSSAAVQAARSKLGALGARVEAAAAASFRFFGPDDNAFLVYARD
ncbi:MAG: nucleoside triphosphate pyrophosphohydrolase [Myxococcaceae bacterium]|nr:nucleoside triphosphate pyrophosphohydrolase [Myxococcaceae bacterium]